MSIQSNINQAISLTTLLATQTSVYKTAAEKRNIDKQIASLKKGRELLNPNAPTYLESLEAEAGAAKRKFMIDPSIKTGTAAQEAKVAVDVEKERRATNAAEEAEWEYWEEYNRGWEESNLDAEMMNRADTNLQSKQTALRNINQRKQGYMAPAMTQVTNRNEKRKYMTQMEQMNKQEKREEQRREMNG